MSIEIVTSPESGVIVSLSSNYILAGHRFSLTFDAIQRDSIAYNSLAAAEEKESLRLLVSPRSRRRRQVEADVDDFVSKLESQLESAKMKTRKSLKDSLKSKITGLWAQIKSAHRSQSVKPSAPPTNEKTPNSAQ